jgi:hypothetical protein
MIRRLAWVAGFLVLIQFIPYGHHHTNPPVVKEPAWDSPQTRALAKRACFDCHSNETTWPWYSHVAPVSWLVQDDVDGGRHHLNFSEWDKPQRHAHDAAEEIENGDMPIWFYVPLHPAAKLSAEEKAALIAGLKKMPGFQKEND